MLARPRRARPQEPRPAWAGCRPGALALGAWLAAASAWAQPAASPPTPPAAAPGAEPTAAAAAGSAAAGSAPGAAAGACPAGDLLGRAQLVRWLDTTGATAKLTDGVGVPEGAPWYDEAVQFTSAGGSLTWDLGGEFALGEVAWQGEATRGWSLQTSLDRQRWTVVTLEPVEAPPGLRARRARLSGAPARYVRFGEPTGEGPAAVSELRLFCQPPGEAAAAWRVLDRPPPPGPSPIPQGSAWEALTGSPILTQVQTEALRLSLLVSAAAVLLFGLCLRRGERAGEAAPASWEQVPELRRALLPAVALGALPASLAALAATLPHGAEGIAAWVALGLALPAVGLFAVALRMAATGRFYARQGEAPAATRLPRLRRALLVALAVASWGGYYSWGAYRFPDFVHRHDFFHYFIGGKYFRELGYGGLYDCTAAAEADQGFRRRVELRKLRDLGTNAIIGGPAVLQRAPDCRRRFSAARWEQFKRDTSFFNDPAEPARMQRMLRDHGFNGSPVGNMTGALVAGDRPASRAWVGYGDRALTGVLALIDPALIVAALAAVAWAWGCPTACVAAIFLGDNALSTYPWTGGSYLRQDWLLLMLAGLALLKKERWAAGGAVLAWSATIRVFPGLLLVPVAARLAWVGWQERRLDREAARALAGAALAGALLVGASAAHAGGAWAWRDFAANTAKHAATPQANLVGLPTLLSFRPSTRVDVLADPSLEDPTAPVRQARHATSRQMMPARALAVAAALAAVARLARRRPPLWLAAAAGMALVPLALELSCYYFSFLMVAALLGKEHRDLSLGLLATGVLLSVLELALPVSDVRYALSSLPVAAFCGWLLWRVGSPRPAPEAP